MPLALALILSLAAPASAQMRNLRGCTHNQQAMIDAAFPEARKRIAEAQEKVKAGDAKAAEVGRVMFGGDYNENNVGAVLDLMAGALGTAVGHCAAEKDVNCGNRAGYVRSDERDIMHLCPKFFKEKALPDSAPPAEQRIRTIVHESAHLAHPNISEPGGESYCVVFSCEFSCGEGPREGNRSVPGRVADNWAQFVNCASGQKPDEIETITVSPRKKKK